MTNTAQDKIIVKGARENNLKNVSFEFPKNKLVVFTGVSGSGKSSMAFDTLFAEGQRRYVESLSSYARQFLGNMKRPEVDLIEGLSPSIAINQKAISHNPRSTVGTVTEIYDYLRLLFARIGHPHCPHCNREVAPQTSKQIVNQIISDTKTKIIGPESFRFLVLSPLVRNKAGDFRGLTENLRKQGYKYIRVDDHIIDLYSDFIIAKTNKHNIDAVVDRVTVSKDNLKQENQKELYDRLIDDIEQAMKLSNGLVITAEIFDSSFTFPEHPKEMKDILYSENFACPNCNISLPEIEPRLFSFNSPQGACIECKGLGSKFQIDRSKFPEWKAKMLENKYFTSTSETVREELEKLMIKETCPSCMGSRLNPDALSVTVLAKNIHQISVLPIEQLARWISDLEKELESDKEKEILIPIKKEISARLEFLLAVGLDYLSLEREAGTLSSGESQRIRLASQIGTGLTGVLYILDEPTIGLHSRDNDRLISTLKKLKELGNTVVVVEHDEDVIRNADHIVDFGILAGKNGGEVVAQGSLSDILSSKNSITAKYLSGKQEITSEKQIKSIDPETIRLNGCRQWNLKNINVEFPLNNLICVTGVSGSGKSTLIHDTLYGGVRKSIHGAYYGTIGEYNSIEGCQYISDVLLVDQSPIGRTPRSNPSTYTKVFDEIRKLMAQTPEAQIRGYGPGRFSFNVKNGRCEACEGQGQIKIEMQFLPDIYVTCEDCGGTRYKDETLEVEYKGKNISEILNMTIDEAAEFFRNIPIIKRKLSTIQEVGLGYLELGQPSNTLSGGESQRLKISRELVKKQGSKTLYILDEPTTGLHFYDIDKLIKVLRKLVDMGNTVVVIEHNLDVIKNADHIIDLGPEGGERGGYLVASGNPGDIMNAEKSYTGKYLKKHLEYNVQPQKSR
ncbi:MAG: excinuclease ABC subunit UvrA [Patescibacteria group bacterium]|jgi:excinuclease ABC subunit A